MCAGDLDRPSAARCAGERPRARNRAPLVNELNERLHQPTLALPGPLRDLRGVGPKVEAALHAVGLRTIADLLAFFPRRGEHVRELRAPCDDGVGSLVRFPCTVESAAVQYLPRRRSLVRVRVVAADGTRCEVAYFNQPYLARTFASGQERVAEGVLLRDRQRFVLRPGRLLAAASVESGPVRLRYPAIEGVSEQRLRRFLREALSRAALDASPLAPLPSALAGEDLTYRDAVFAMHAPGSAAEHERARRFFAVHEALGVFAAIERARRARAEALAPPVRFSAVLEARLRARIPLQWTDDQSAALAELRRGLAGPAPLGLLLQGDVGTGKTAVAVWAALAAVASGLQVAFLAPTELLAEQHHAKVCQWLVGSRVRVELLTGSLSRPARTSADAAVASGEAQIVFGTHALLSAATRFSRLGLVVIDEQHRFGVEQRQMMVRKGTHPHVLVLTATPIPRTLAFVLFGDLQVALLRTRPGGSRPAPARHVRGQAWARVQRCITRRLGRGRNVYVVCPSIDADEHGATAVHAFLSRRFTCGLVHGRLRAGERLDVLRRFRAGELQVLVGTTVLEVGLDVPSATLMVVVEAHRFGLATLHQLRGRAGRAAARGLCLVLGPQTERTRALCRTTDGFVLAELDLALRGSGELLGLRQSGSGELRALDPVGDLELLARVRAAVQEGANGSDAADPGVRPARTARRG